MQETRLDTTRIRATRRVIDPIFLDTPLYRCAALGPLAWSGRGRGLDVTVVASRFATVAKLDRIRALGARLELVDGDHEPAREQRRVVTTDSTNTIADGVAGRRPIPAVLDDLLLVADDAVLVQESSITRSSCVQTSAPDQLARDDIALDLVDTLADDHQRGVTEVALDVELGRVAVTAVDADGVQGDLHRGL
ncbi:hypothetical protein [Streptomyces asiaticus]